MPQSEFSLFERVLTYVETDEGVYWNEGLITGILYQSGYIIGEDWAYQVTFYDSPSFAKHIKPPVNEFMSLSELNKID